MKIKQWIIGFWQGCCDIWTFFSRLNKVESKVWALEYVLRGIGRGLKTESDWTEWNTLGICFRGLDRDTLISYQKAIGMWPSEENIKKRISKGRLRGLS